jgi:hypothetical protein
MAWINGLSKSIKCFLDWPMLHTRIMSYCGLFFFFQQLDMLREKDSVNLIAQSLAQGYQFGVLFIIGFYIAPKIAEKVTEAVISFRFGNQKKDTPP